MLRHMTYISGEVESTKAVADISCLRPRSGQLSASISQVLQSCRRVEYEFFHFRGLFPGCLGQTQNDAAEEFDP